MHRFAQSHSNRRTARWLLASSILLAGALPAAAAGEVEGTYVGNGKAAKLAYAVVTPHEEWSGEKAYTLILAAKDPGKSKKPDFDAQFGELGDALVISFTQSGSIFSVQVCHQSLEKSGFSTSGTLQVDGFQMAGGTVSAHFFTKGEQEFFGDKWQVDLKVKAALPK